MADKGILSFIKMKLEHGSTPDEVHDMLIRAGFHESHVAHAFDEVKKNFNDTHQDLVAQNDFLPPLDKSPQKNLGKGGTLADLERIHNLKKEAVHSGHSSAGQHQGLFAGRLRRKDFVLGFLFFFGLGYIALALAGLILSQLTPNIWIEILNTIELDRDNMLLMIIPVVLFPITIMMLSLIARRLHNLGLPGGIAFMFLTWFVPSFKIINPIGELGLQIALAILFIVLVTVKGNPAPNIYGPFPQSNGSFFKKIFNV